MKRILSIFLSFLLSTSNASSQDTLLVFKAGSVTYKCVLTDDLSLTFERKIALPAIGSVNYNGDIYNYITVGNQTWMIENLNTTKYNDGTNISVDFSGTSGAYTQYTGGTAENGKLYNWYAVSTGKLAPEGWHIASDTEWTILTDYVTAHLGTSLSLAKALASSNWSSYTGTGTIGDNLSLNNSSGLGTQPAGFRYSNGTFSGFGIYGHWWSSSQSDVNNGWYRSMTYFLDYVTRYDCDKKYGLSVRCVRDY